MGTRTEILEYLGNHAYASAEDLFLLLSKTRANIQYHLKQLENSGIICVVTPKKEKAYRGRPRRYYALSLTERPNNLAQLAHALLVTNQANYQKQSEYYQAVAHQILDLPDPPSSGTTRLNRLIKELSSRGYQARWEAHASGPEILFRNCPYATLLPEHTELCLVDKTLLEENLGTSFIQQFRIDLPHVPACRFLKKP
jgi:predicted ArsR family transcriptional regulator